MVGSGTPGKAGASERIPQFQNLWDSRRTNPWQPWFGASI